MIYRPTPVLDPGPPRDAVMSRLPAGTMRGYTSNVNWRGFFDEARRACQGKPWIVRSGTMGNFGGMGDATLDPTAIDLSSLPLAPVDSSLTSLMPGLPTDFFNMPAPIAPSIAPYNPGSPPAIVSSGGSITSPAGTSYTSIINSLASLGTNIARAVTGQQVNPLVAPVVPAAAPATQTSLVSQAQALQSQAAQLAATNPALAAQYTASANAYLAQAGVSTGTSWFTQSSVIPGLPNWGILAGGGAAILLMLSMGSKGRK